MNSESSSKSGNYINVVNEFSPESAELFNGRWAMIGITSLIGAYATTGQIIPGFFKITFNSLLIFIYVHSASMMNLLIMSYIYVYNML